MSATANGSLTITLDGSNKSSKLPLIQGTLGPAVADIRKIYNDLGIFTFDPGYGCYTWGKLEIRTLRDQAQAQWGLRYSHQRFHQVLLDQGAPPLGLMGTTLD